MLKSKRKNALGITEMGLGPPVISDIYFITWADPSPRRSSIISFPFGYSRSVEQGGRTAIRPASGVDFVVVGTFSPSSTSTAPASRVSIPLPGFQIILLRHWIKSLHFCRKKKGPVILLTSRPRRRRQCRATTMREAIRSVPMAPDFPLQILIHFFSRALVLEWILLCNRGH